MSRNKPRLELALYGRPKHLHSYRYALFVAPKSTKHAPAVSGVKHHIKDTVQTIAGEIRQPWRYERVAIEDINSEACLLVRVVVAKVTDLDAVQRILSRVPVPPANALDPDQATAFTCQAWTRDALRELRAQGAVAGLGEWDAVRQRAVDYVAKKKEKGRWEVGWKGGEGVPLLDMLDGAEIVA
jgi:hypothetical protein